MPFWLVKLKLINSDFIVRADPDRCACQLRVIDVRDGCIDVDADRTLFGKVDIGAADTNCWTIIHRLNIERQDRRGDRGPTTSRVALIVYRNGDGCLSKEVRVRSVVETAERRIDLTDGSREGHRAATVTGGKVHSACWDGNDAVIRRDRGPTDQRRWRRRRRFEPASP